MTKQKSTKRALLMSGLALLLCVSMLIGSTFAWFTDSVTSAGNKIQSGTLKLDLELLDKDTGWASIKESKAPIFNYDLWEPGYTDVKVLKVENEGSLALKWYAKFISADTLSILADVIDVYVRPSATEIGYPADRNLDGYTKVGTVRDFVNNIEETTKGALTPKGTAGAISYLGIALKMREEAGNEYQGLTLGAFDIMILATQETYESDSFDNQYDANAEFDKVALPAKNVTVTTPDEFKAALADAANGDREVNIDATGVTLVPTNDKATTVVIPSGVTVKGATFDHNGESFLFVGEGDMPVAFENCTFIGEPLSQFKIATEGCDNITYTDCEFTGLMMVNNTVNRDAVNTFNNCTFGLTNGFIKCGYVNCMAGENIFNQCTFNYNGGSTMGSGPVSKWNAVNAYSENTNSLESNNYTTYVELSGCTRNNCSTFANTSNSTIVVK